MTAFSARIIGPGRAGTALAGALQRAGWTVELLGRDDDVRGAGLGVDVIVIATPDSVIAEVAALVTPMSHVLVVHLAGSLGLDVLEPHERVASLHPLTAIPHGDLGVERLVGAHYAVDGDPGVGDLVDALEGTALTVRDRTAYHAAACMASNHLVGLLGQVERVAATAGVPLEAYLDLVRATVDNVAELGPSAALTGPVARGDWATVARHLDALPADERPAYRIMADAAARLTRDVPCAP